MGTLEMLHHKDSGPNSFDGISRGYLGFGAFAI